MTYDLITETESETDSIVVLKKMKQDDSLGKSYEKENVHEEIKITRTMDPDKTFSRPLKLYVLKVVLLFILTNHFNSTKNNSTKNLNIIKKSCKGSRDLQKWMEKRAFEKYEHKRKQLLNSKNKSFLSKQTERALNSIGKQSKFDEILYLEIK